MNTEEQLATINEQLREITDRSRRTETGLHKIREHLGINGDRGQVKVLGSNDVEVQGYDVTLSQIRKTLLAADKFIVGDRVAVRGKEGVFAVVIFPVAQP